MKRLLTLLIIAPMIAGAQVNDSALKPFLTDTTVITSGRLSLYADTNYVDVTDTIPRKMLVVDTCKDGPVLFINGYVIRKYRKSSYGYSLADIFNPPVGILNRSKKPLGKCFAIWQY